MAAPRPYLTGLFNNLNIYRTLFYLFPLCGTLKCLLVRCIFGNCTSALARAHVSRYHKVGHNTNGICACAFAEQKKLSTTSGRSFGFFTALLLMA